MEHDKKKTVAQNRHIPPNQRPKQKENLTHHERLLRQSRLNQRLIDLEKKQAGFTTYWPAISVGAALVAGGVGVLIYRRIKLHQQSKLSESAANILDMVWEKAPPAKIVAAIDRLKLRKEKRDAWLNAFQQEKTGREIPWNRTDIEPTLDRIEKYVQLGIWPKEASSN